MEALIIVGAKYLMYFIAAGAAVAIWLSPKRNRLIVFSLVAIALGWLLARLLGEFWYDPQPFVVGRFEPLIHQAVGNGFPSDHTLGSAIAASVAWLINPLLGYFLWVLAVLVGLSRVGAGVHHFVDVLAGAALGAGVVWALHKLFVRKGWL